MLLLVPQSTFWDWQPDFGFHLWNMNIYTLHVKFGSSKPVIIIGSCVVKSWFTFTNMQCVSNCQDQNKCTRIRSILEQIEFSTIFWKTVSNQLQLRADVELKILSVYLQLGALFPLVNNRSHSGLFWPINAHYIQCEMNISLPVCHVCWQWPSSLRSDPWPHRG